MTQEQIQLQGKLVHVIYHHPETHYCVARFKLNTLEEKVIMITGHLSSLPLESLLELKGSFVEHPRYGRQFQFTEVHKILPSDESSIIRFLSSPLFPGIGEKFASAIVAYWGNESLEKLKENIDILDIIKGSTSKKKEVIRAGLESYGENEEAIRFFTTHGLSIRQIMRLERIYGEESYEKVRENPYRLVEEVDGFGFRLADKLALSMGFEADHPYRLEALLVSLCLDRCMRSGDSFALLDDLAWAYQKETQRDDCLDVLDRCIDQHKLILMDGKVFHPSQYHAERQIGQFLSHFPFETIETLDESQIDLALNQLEQDLGIHYDNDQKAAIHTFFASPLSIMTGGPGTGKSTVIGAIIHLWKQLYPHRQLACVAPTGRASKRLFELNGVESYTIHSLLRWDLEANSFGMNENNPLALDCLIIDEFSMVDTWLFSQLLRASVQLKKILIVGDKDQLPSVMPGQVLKDLMESKFIPTLQLKQIYRQKDGSDIIELAYQIRENKLDFKSLNRDIHWIDSTGVHAKFEILDQVRQLLDNGYQIQDIQLISPMYSGQLGIDSLNHSLQQLLNPAHPDKPELAMMSQILRVADKVLQLKNQADDNVFNGDIGECIEIETTQQKRKQLLARFDDNYVSYEGDQLSHLTLAYCISVHKAQGSEYPIIIFPISKEHRYMLDKRLIYTAITRASKKLILIGNPNEFKQILTEKHGRERQTLLKTYLES